MKIAVVTTFPVDYPTWQEMLATFDANWPSDIELYIALDKVDEPTHVRLVEEANRLMPSGRQFFVSNTWSEDKEAFFKRNQDSPNLPYRFQVCRFSHKVFALYATMNAIKEREFNYLIWLDADVITHKPISHEALKELIPHDQAVSYLGRSDAPHSECSFMAFNLKCGGQHVIESMHTKYITDAVLELPGWTDCDVFDSVIKGTANKNLTANVKGWHVFVH